MRHTLEASEASVAILCARSYVSLAAFIQFVSVSGKDGIEIEGVVLPPFQSDIHREVAPRARLCCHIV